MDKEIYTANQGIPLCFLQIAKIQRYNCKLHLFDDL